MSENIQDAILLITSSEPENRNFGTGFVIHKDETSTYIVTCAHVIRDVGGDDRIKANGHSVSVIASGSDDGADDLAVLKINTVLDVPSLELHTSSQVNDDFVAIGFQRLLKQHLIRPVQGSLGQEVGLQAREQIEQRIKAWDLKIIDDYNLERGYSGSPVINQITESVMGVVSHRLREGDSGIAISIEALQLIWPKMPANLISADPNLTSKPRFTTIVVGKSGERDFNSINEAIRKASSGALILVRPGTYRESVYIDKNITLKGDGSREQVLIEFEDRNCVVVETKYAEIENITLKIISSNKFRMVTKEEIKQRPVLHKRLEKHPSSIFVRQGNFSLKDSSIFIDGGIGISIVSQNAKSNIQNCAIQSNNRNRTSVGVAIWEGGKGAFENTNISCDTSIWGEHNSQLNMIGCEIDKGFTGIYLHSARVTLNKCTITNFSQGIYADFNSNISVTECRLEKNEIGITSNETQIAIDSCVIENSGGVGVVLQTLFKHSAFIRRNTIIKSGYLGIMISKEIERDYQHSVNNQDERGLKVTPVGINSSIDSLSQGKIHIEYCQISNNGLAGAKIDYSLGECKQIYFNQCEINNHRGPGIHFEINNLLEDCFVHSCKIERNYCGILVDYCKSKTSSAKLHILNCHIHNNLSGSYSGFLDGENDVMGGVMFWQQAECEMKNCDLSRNKHFGLLLVAFKEMRIYLENCKVERSDCGIYAVGEGTVIHAKSCKFLKNARYGIYLKESQHSTFRRCDINDNVDAGVRCEGNTKNILFENCDVRNNGALRDMGIFNLVVKTGAFSLEDGSSVKRVGNKE